MHMATTNMGNKMMNKQRDVMRVFRRTKIEVIDAKRALFHAKAEREEEWGGRVDQGKWRRACDEWRMRMG